MLEGELDRLIPLCAERTLSTGPAAHRANAVAALESLAAYPYHLLHPFRPQVNITCSAGVTTSVFSAAHCREAIYW